MKALLLMVLAAPLYAQIPIGGVTKISAGANVSVSPTSGVGDVTVSSTGTGGGTIATTPDILKGDNAGNAIAALPLATGGAVIPSGPASPPADIVGFGSGGQIVDTGYPTSSLGSLVNNLLVNSPSTGLFFSNADSIGLPLNGYPAQLATLLGIPSGHQTINSIGSASLPDWLSCATTAGCSAGGAYPYQIGTFPLTFPLGVTTNAKAVLEAGYNDLSNMGGTPSNNQLSYWAGGLKAWSLVYALPDIQKLTASANCTTTGTWTSVSAVPGGSGTFPAGTIETSTPGATLVCTGYNATEAGIIGYKYTSSTTATYTVSVVNAGATSNVADPYTTSTTLNQTAYYTTAWGGLANLYAIGQSGLGGGYTTITLTTASNSSDPVIVVAPYFISPSSVPQNAPAVEWALESRAGCNGTCSTVSGTLHNDSNTNIMRAAQVSVVNDLRSNGLNISYFDPNATPTGYNSSDTAQTTKLTSFSISGGGSGFTGSTSIPTFSGCTINPVAAPITISGGALVTGTYYTTSEGSCLGATITATFSGGGTGVSYTATATSDGTHPNQTGQANFAAAALVNLNSAADTQDHFLPITAPTSGGCTNNCTFTGQTTLSGGSTEAPLIVTSSNSNGTVFGLSGTASGVHALGFQTTSFGDFLQSDGTNANFFTAFGVGTGNPPTGYVSIGSKQVFGWVSGRIADTVANVPDTALSRLSADAVACGNGTWADASCTFSAAVGIFGNIVPSTGNIAGTLGVLQNNNSGGITGYSINDNTPATQGIFGYNNGYSALTNTVHKFFFLSPTSPICFITVVGGSACDLNLSASQGGATFGVNVTAPNITVSTLGSAMTKSVSGLLTPAVAGTDFMSPPVSNAITSATGGSGTGTVACATASCTNLRGSYTVAGGTFATGTLLTLVWPTTTTAYVCSGSVLNNATGASIGYHSVATATGTTFNSLTAATGLSVDIDYSCQP
jgi:hypothetical protein